MAKSPVLKQSRFRTLADVFARLGDIPASRVLSYPAPGTAEGCDFIDPGITLHRVVEHVDGILVEKTWDNRKFQIALRIMAGMDAAIRVENSGAILGPKCRV